MTEPNPVEPRRDDDADAARERLNMDYPVTLDRLPDAAQKDAKPPTAT